MAENMEVSSSVDSGLGEDLGYSDLQKNDNDIIIEIHDILTNYLKKCFVEMMIIELPRYVKKQCWGCQQEGEDYPGKVLHSHTDHDVCLMMMSLWEQLGLLTGAMLRDLVNNPEKMDELWSTRMVFKLCHGENCAVRLATVRNNFYNCERWCYLHSI